MASAAVMSVFRLSSLRNLTAIICSPFCASVRSPLSYRHVTTNIGGGDPEKIPSMTRRRKRKPLIYPKYIPKLKTISKGTTAFIVADIETRMLDSVHVPYAAGFLLLYPGDDVAAKSDVSIEQYFSEDYFDIPEFKDRSNRMLLLFLDRLAAVANKTKIRTVYFRNVSHFDGILLMKCYASSGDKYSIKPLIRNNMLYELLVFQNKKVVLRVKDSLNLLPGSLHSLAKTLCPQLGCKGSIDHDKVDVSNLKQNRVELLEYLKHDIRLLGGVLLKGQEIYWTEFKLDINKSLTLASLAMKIFRTIYYDDNCFPIHRASTNENNFIRRGYYGGHVDVYKPYGENLHYYNVNSLYPYIMQEYPMPGGVPVWHCDLEDQDLSNLCGFIEAYVECPPTICKPFLPYMDTKNNTLLFPTGQFIGVYYSEELLFARNLGYKIIPLKGYLFEKMPTPFKSFVSSIYEKRLEAKRSGHDAMAFGYKILVNLLHGRFGINPISTITDVCSSDRYDDLMKAGSLTFADKLSEDRYIVVYTKNELDVASAAWHPPNLSAVQISAAITACARIHMYQYISRPDCVYTDTDSVVLKNPLPKDEISSTELGKLKLETGVRKGIFRADWHNINIGTKEYITDFNHKEDTKRKAVYDNNGIWVDTEPQHVIDQGGQALAFDKCQLQILREEYDKKKKENEKKQRR